MIVELLETERLQLRKITPAVYDFVFAHYTHEALKTFFGFNTDAEVIREQERHQKGLTTFNKSFLFFHLIAKETNTVMGWCGFHTWYLDHARAEIGYILHQDAFKGKRFMTEALPAIVGYGFDHMQLNRIEAFVSPTNQPSIQLLKNQRFIQEGYLRQHYFSKGEMSDSLLFALLREEHHPQPSPH